MEKKREARAAAMPQANVDPDGRCNTSFHAETERPDTGDACLDGLNWPEAGEDAAVSPKDGTLKTKAAKRESGKKP